MGEKNQHTKETMLDHEVHRAGPNEGFRAPPVEETGVAQSSIYDGAGNEIVVVSSVDDEGNRKQGTGATAEEAMKDVRNPKQPIGEGFGTVGKH